MAEFWITHSLNYNKAVKFNITLRFIVIKGEKGEHMWVLEIGTTYPDASGDPISAKKIHNIDVKDLDEIIESNLADLCSQIDWSPLVQDQTAPYVDSATPADGNMDVSLWASVLVKLKDVLPSAGIDLSEMKMTLNGIDITNTVDIEGDPYEYQLRWNPPIRIQDTYD